MRYHTLRAGAVALALAAGGCESGMQQPEPPDAEAAANEHMVRTLFDQQARNAIVTEHTIYPYHFDADNTTLNELGERQVEVLGPAYRGPRARVSVMRGDAPAALYDARVQAVRARLVAGGIDPANLTITEDAPGGRGISSKSVIEFMQQARDAASQNSQSGPNDQPGISGLDPTRMGTTPYRGAGGSVDPSRQGVGR